MKKLVVGTKEEIAGLPLCECGSGDIRYCNISHRCYCGECDNQPPPHWNEPKYAKIQWEKWAKAAE